MIDDIERLLKESSEKNTTYRSNERYTPSKRERSRYGGPSIYDSRESRYHDRKRMKVDNNQVNRNQRYQNSAVPGPQYSSLHLNIQQQQMQQQQQQLQIQQQNPRPQFNAPAPNYSQTHMNVPQPQQQSTKKQRTIFVHNLKPTVTEQHIRQFFGSTRVLEVILIKDKITGISKGFGFVEFSDVAATRQGLALHGQLIQGYPVYVKPSKTDGPTSKRNVSSLPQPQHVEQPKVWKKSKTEILRIFVRNFPDMLDEEDIKYIFDSCGLVENVEVRTGKVGVHDQPFCLPRIKKIRMPKKKEKKEGEDEKEDEDELDDEEEEQYVDCSQRKEEKYAFVDFAFSEDATKALIRLNGMHVGLGYRLEVGMWNDKPLQKHVELLDDGRNRGIKMTRETRTNLMKEIAGGVMMKEEEEKRKQQQEEERKKEERRKAEAASGASQQSGSMGLAQRPTKNVVLQNMFGLDDAELNFEEILEDVREEVATFGSLEQIFIDKTSKMGEIYLRYGGIQDATNARTNLKGRLYDGKRINVIFLEDDEFFKKFKEC